MFLKRFDLSNSKGLLTYQTAYLDYVLNP